MKNWYVLIDELTHEQECELVQLMFGVKGKALDWDSPKLPVWEDCLGYWVEALNYWFLTTRIMNSCEKLSYKQAVALLEEELSDD